MALGEHFKLSRLKRRLMLETGHSLRTDEWKRWSGSFDSPASAFDAALSWLSEHVALDEAWRWCRIGVAMPQERYDWQSHGFAEPEDVRPWRVLELRAEEAVQLREQGWDSSAVELLATRAKEEGVEAAMCRSWLLSEPRHARSDFWLEKVGPWARKGFGPDEAEAWIREGFRPDEAEAWRLQRFIASDARLWKQHQFDQPVDARRWSRELEALGGLASGRLGDVYSPDLARAWREQGFGSHEFRVWNGGREDPVGVGVAAEWRRTFVNQALDAQVEMFCHWKEIPPAEVRLYLKWDCSPEDLGDLLMVHDPGARRSAVAKQIFASRFGASLRDDGLSSVSIDLTDSNQVAAVGVTMSDLFRAIVDFGIGQLSVTYGNPLLTAEMIRAWPAAQFRRARGKAGFIKWLGSQQHPDTTGWVVQDSEAIWHAGNIPAGVSLNRPGGLHG